MFLHLMCFEEFTLFGSLTKISCFNMKNYHSKSPARLCANTAKTSLASTILKFLVAHHQVFKLSCLLMQHMPQLVAPWLEPLTSNARVSLVRSGVSGVARHVAPLSEWSKTSSSISECILCICLVIVLSIHPCIQFYLWVFVTYQCADWSGSQS